MAGPRERWEHNSGLVLHRAVRVVWKVWNTRRCEEVGTQKWLTGAGGDAVFTQMAGDSQGFWRWLWEAWRSGGGLRECEASFPFLLNYTGEFWKSGMDVNCLWGWYVDDVSTFPA